MSGNTIHVPACPCIRCSVRNKNERIAELERIVAASLKKRDDGLIDCLDEIGEGWRKRAEAAEALLQVEDQHVQRLVRERQEETRRADAADAEVGRLRPLVGYARHLGGCVYQLHADDCDCGYLDAMDACRAAGKPLGGGGGT